MGFQIILDGSITFTAVEECEAFVDQWAIDLVYQPLSIDVVAINDFRSKQRFSGANYERLVRIPRQWCTQWQGNYLHR